MRKKRIKSCFKRIAVKKKSERRSKKHHRKKTYLNREEAHTPYEHPPG